MKGKAERGALLKKELELFQINMIVDLFPRQVCSDAD